jgi:hypothetical protein
MFMLARTGETLVPPLFAIGSSDLTNLHFW